MLLDDPSGPISLPYPRPPTVQASPEKPDYMHMLIGSWETGNREETPHSNQNPRGQLKSHLLVPPHAQCPETGVVFPLGLWPGWEGTLGTQH